MRRRNIKTADVGGRSRREFVVRLPLERYEGLTKIAFKNGSSLNYEINEALRTVLVKAGLERETDGC